MVRQLIENGAAVDRRSGDGTTALMLATANNCEEESSICKVLDMGDRKRRLIPGHHRPG